MIRTSQVHHCRACGSTHIVKNGRNRSGSQQYQCRTCGASKGAAFQATLQRGAQGRGAASLSGAFLAAGTQPHLRDHAQNDHAVVKKTPEPAHRQGNPVRGQGQCCPRTRRGLVVRVAAQEQALALDGDVPHRTRQIVAFANGDHSEGACRALWEPVAGDLSQVP